MKAVTLAIKFLLALFLTIAVSVHVQGIFKPETSEPLWSHIVHILSYGLCLITVITRVSNRQWLYIVGAAYPFFFHARCALVQFQDKHTLNAICLLVVVLMPLMAVFVFYDARKQAIS